VDAEHLVPLAGQHGSERPTKLSKSDDGDSHTTTLDRLSRDHEVPTKLTLKGPEERLGHPAEVRLFYIAILHVVAHPVPQPVIDRHLVHSEPVPLDELSTFSPAI